MKKTFVGFMLAAMTVVLCACVPDNYSKDMKNEYLDKGKVLIEQYLGETYKEYSLETLDVCTGTRIFNGTERDYGNNLTNVVSATYTVDGHEFSIYVNTVTKECYTNDYSFDLCAVFEDYIESEFEKAGLSFETYVRQVNTDISITSDNVPSSDNGTISTITTIRNVLPVSVNEANATEYLTENHGCVFYATIYTDVTGKVISEETWNTVKGSCPNIESININVIDSDSLKESIRDRKLAAGAILNLTEEYTLNTDYSYIMYSVKNYNDIYVVSSDYYYEKRSDSEDSLEKNCTTEFSETESEIIINTEGYSYILFKGGSDYEGKTVKLANTMVQHDENPTEYGYIHYYGDFYSIDNQYGFPPYSFSNKLVIAK